MATLADVFGLATATDLHVSRLPPYFDDDDLVRGLRSLVVAADEREDAPTVSVMREKDAGSSSAAAEGELPSTSAAAESVADAVKQAATVAFKDAIAAGATPAEAKAAGRAAGKEASKRARGPRCRGYAFLKFPSAAAAAAALELLQGAVVELGGAPVALVVQAARPRKAAAPEKPKADRPKAPAKKEEDLPDLHFRQKREPSRRKHPRSLTCSDKSAVVRDKQTGKLTRDADTANQYRSRSVADQHTLARREYH